MTLKSVNVRRSAAAGTVTSLTELNRPVFTVVEWLGFARTKGLLACIDARVKDCTETMMIKRLTGVVSIANMLSQQRR